MPETLFDKVWNRHVVAAETIDPPGVLYVDLHLVHEVTSPQAFSEIESRGLTVRRPDRTFATLDHSTPTLPANVDGERPYVTPAARSQVERLEANCKRHGIRLAGWDSQDRGVVHVMGPELGLTQPGMTVVCGDSHTATHGAFGALAFGIGTSEVGHVLATQCLLQRKPKAMRVTVTGRLQAGVSGKDVALAIIARLGFHAEGRLAFAHRLHRPIDAGFRARGDFDRARFGVHRLQRVAVEFERDPHGLRRVVIVLHNGGEQAFIALDEEPWRLQADEEVLRRDDFRAALADAGAAGERPDAGLPGG